MKIVHICEIATVTDGHTYQDNLLPKYHVKCGYDTTIITHCYVQKETKYIKIDPGEYINSDGVKVVRLPIKNGRNGLSRFKRLKYLYKTIEDEKPDILFVHGCQYLDVDVLCNYKDKHPEVRMFVDNHSDFTNSGTNRLSYAVLHRIIWRHCAQKLVPYTEMFYGVLPARVDFLRNVYDIPSDKVELLVMGADDIEVQKAKDNKAQDDIRNRFDVNDGDILIVTGGKIDRFKSQTVQLMEVIQKINDPRLHLIVFGGVSEELKERVERNNYGNVHFIGWINASESYAYFEAADIVIFPGRHSVFWEQVAGQGKPMIVRKWPGTEHIDLGGNVRFLNSDKPEEIENVLRELLTDSRAMEYMKRIAVEKGMVEFSYKDIALRSINGGVRKC